jgi:hypothetical protein
MPPLTTTMVPARELRVGDFATSDGASGVIRNVHSVQNRLLYVSIDRPPARADEWPHRPRPPHRGAAHYLAITNRLRLSTRRMLTGTLVR